MRSVWFAGDVGFGREPVMSVIGEKYSVELLRKKSHGADWTVLTFTDAAGNKRGVKWHTDATDTELAFAFTRFADSLNPRPPKQK